MVEECKCLDEAGLGGPMTGHTCITAADWEGTLDLPLPNPLYGFMKTSRE